MKITKEIYDAACAKRNVATAQFRAQLEKGIAVAQALPLGQQRKAATEACERYEKDCIPAVKEWQHDLGFIGK